MIKKKKVFFKVFFTAATILAIFLSLMFFSAEASFTDVPYAEEEIITLCNILRQEHGLAPLVHNWEAARVARYKTEDMKSNNYFSHDSPVYGSFFDMLENFRIPYKSAGENIAKGLSTPQKVVDAWMASPSHRKNILSKSFSQAGVGYSTNGTVHYWALILLDP